METILNLLRLTPGERTAFLAAAPHAKHIFLPVSTQSANAATATPEQLGEADIIFGCPPPKALAGATRLKWLQTWSAGVDQYLTPGVLPQGAILTSAVGAYGPAVSEHMFACVLSLLKRLPQLRDNQAARVWHDAGNVRSLRGATVLLLGTGDIGSHFAALVKAMGAHTLGLNRHPDKPVAHIDELHHLDELDRWLPRADVVAMTLPETPGTIHIINDRRLALMREDAILVNAGRGTAVDNWALAHSLNAGHLWGAALDVTEPEPLPADHPLWDCKNLLLTPHSAGGDHLDLTVRNIAAIALENLTRYLTGEPLRNRVV